MICHENKPNQTKPESILENTTQKFFWDFETPTDHQITARRSDLMIINKKENLPNDRLFCPGRTQWKSRKRKERQVLGLCRRTCLFLRLPEKLSLYDCLSTFLKTKFNGDIITVVSSSFSSFILYLYFIFNNLLFLTFIPF